MPKKSKAGKIPLDVVRKLFLARDALVADDLAEAYHQLYLIADPTLSSYYPWRALERQASEVHDTQK